MTTFEISMEEFTKQVSESIEVTKNEIINSAVRNAIKSNPIYHIRAEQIRPNELLYDSKGLIVAIKTKGQILAILEGDL